MKATGIVRRIDDLGRVVIPKEIRRTLRIREGDPLEIYLHEDGVVFRKYSIMDALQDADKYAQIAARRTTYGIVICDREKVVATSRGVKPIFRDAHTLENTDSWARNPVTRVIPLEYADCYTEQKNEAEMVIPIMVEGEYVGCVIVLAENGKDRPDETVKTALYTVIDCMTMGMG